MNYTELLKNELDYVYRATEGLIKEAEGLPLDWKPAATNNWMTLGQLLLHTATACGQPSKGFVSGDWGLPEGMELKDIPMEEMLPPAEKMPAAQSVDQALQLLRADREAAFAAVERAGENRLQTEPAPAPWDPTPIVLGQRLLQMTSHLATHKAQLFYYLKLQGKPVNTGHLWGVQ